MGLKFALERLENLQTLTQAKERCRSTTRRTLARSAARASYAPFRTCVEWHWRRVIASEIYAVRI